MKTSEASTKKEKKKMPACMAELDFEILCKLGGKEEAIQTMRILNGIRRGKATGNDTIN